MIERCAELEILSIPAARIDYLWGRQEETGPFLDSLDLHLTSDGSAAGKRSQAQSLHSSTLTSLFTGSSATRTVSTNPPHRPALTTMLFDADVRLAHDATAACRRVACLDDGIS